MFFKIRSLTVLLLLITLLLTGCFLWEKEKVPLKIGVVVSKVFDDDCEYLKGFNIGLQDFYNNPVDTEVIAYKIIVTDTKELHEALDSLLITEKVDVLYGFDESWMLQETAFYTRKKNVPVFTPWITEPFKNSSSFPNVFYCQLSNTEQTSALTEFAVDRKNSWVFMDESVTDLRRKGSAFVSRFQELGGVVLLRENVKGKLSNYELRKKYNIVANKPDNFYVAVTKEKLKDIVSDLNNLLSHNLPLFCDIRLSYREMKEISMMYQGKMYFYYYLNYTEIDNEELSQFLLKYHRNCGIQLKTDTPVIEYDFVKYLMKAHQLEEGENYLDKLTRTRYSGLSGDVWIDGKTGKIRKDIGIVEMINGQVENFKFLTPEMGY